MNRAVGERERRNTKSERLGGRDWGAVVIFLAAGLAVSAIAFGSCVAKINAGKVGGCGVTRTMGSSRKQDARGIGMDRTSAVGAPGQPPISLQAVAPAGGLPNASGANVLGGPLVVSMVERRFRVTAYCPCEKCCGAWADGITASGTRADHRLVAAPREFPFGTVMAIPGYGTVRVEDRGGAIRGDRLDILFPTHAEALVWGVQWLDVAVGQ